MVGPLDPRCFEHDHDFRWESLEHEILSLIATMNNHPPPLHCRRCGITLEEAVNQVVRELERKEAVH